MLLWIARLLARLPLSWLQSLGGTLGKMALALSDNFRGKSQTNLRLAGLYEPTLMRRAADQSGQAVAETALLWFGARERIDRLIRVKHGPFYEDIQPSKQTNHGSRVKFSHEKLKSTK